MHCAWSLTYIWWKRAWSLGCIQLPTCRNNVLAQVILQSVDYSIPCRLFLVASGPGAYSWQDVFPFPFLEQLVPSILGHSWRHQELLCTHNTVRVNPGPTESEINHFHSPRSRWTTAKLIRTTQNRLENSPFFKLANYWKNNHKKPMSETIRNRYILYIVSYVQPSHQMTSRT